MGDQSIEQCVSEPPEANEAKRERADGNVGTYLQPGKEADVHESVDIFQVLVDVQCCDKC